MSSYPVNMAFAIDRLLLAAVAHGLGTSYVNLLGEEKLRQLISAPSDIKVVGIIPPGSPAEVPQPPGSKNFSETLSYNC